MLALMRVNEWPEEDRPREKLARRGAGALSDSELLAILVRTGIKGRSALDIARGLCSDGLPELASVSFDELARLPGVGTSRAAAIHAAFELGRRARIEGGPRPDLSSPESVYKYCGPRLNHLKKERFLALAVDTKNRLMRELLISEGDLSSSIVHPREVFQPLIQMSAACVIFVHNHPSGDPSPSQRDAEITTRLRQVGELLGIRVLDHVVVATNGFYSFQSHGYFT